MNKEELLSKIQELVGEGNLDKAKSFLEENKDQLGEYYDKTKELLHVDEGGVEGLLDKVKGFFGK